MKYGRDRDQKDTTEILWRVSLSSRMLRFQLFQPRVLLLSLLLLSSSVPALPVAVRLTKRPNRRMASSTASTGTFSSSAPSKDPSAWLRIIQINDVYELDNFPRLHTLIQQHRVGGAAAGAPSSAELTESTTSLDTPTSAPSSASFAKTIVVCAGDFLAPSLLSSLDQGAAMVDCFNALGVTHVSIGNHEADVSLAALKDRIQQSNFCWLNTNIPTLDEVLISASSSSPASDTLAPLTTRYEILEVPSTSPTVPPKRVALLGLLTHDPSLYRPNAFGGATIRPMVEATLDIQDELLHSAAPEAPRVDLMVPLTHQGIVDDRLYATQFGGTDAPRQMPVLCGGHDHEVYLEDVASCCIVKAGMDATHAAIIDVQWWESDATDASMDANRTETNPTVSVQLIPVTNYTPDADMEQRVQGHLRILQELEKAKLFAISDWMLTSHRHHSAPHHESTVFSTANNRLGPSTGTTALCTMLRMGMRAQCALINAGAIRGGQVYHAHNKTHFTWSDLKAEIPFATGLIACFIPGRVVRDTIGHSRRGARTTPPTASGGYLHTCSNIVYHDATDEIVSIRGQAFDADQLYLTALPAQFFGGIDNHAPLLQWAATERLRHGNSIDSAPDLFSEEAAIPAKMVLVQVFASSMWLQMGGFADIDANRDGVIQRDEVRARVAQLYGHDDVADLIVDNIFGVADMNGDGTISPLEMMICHFVATDILDHVCTQQELVAMKEIAAHVLQKDPSHDDVRAMVHQIRDAMDQEGDGTINRVDVMNALGSLHRSELLR